MMNSGARSRLNLMSGNLSLEAESVAAPLNV
jgi:hypothetical protein